MSFPQIFDRGNVLQSVVVPLPGSFVTIFGFVSILITWVGIPDAPMQNSMGFDS